MSALSSAVPLGNDDALFARAQAGDDSAWEELFRKCYPKVIRVVRRKMNRPMRSVYDSTDFVSDAMKSLAANAGKLDFPSFDSLLAFLMQVAESKVVDEHRKEHSQKRDVTRKVALRPSDDGSRGSGAFASDDPTASQIAVASEEHQRLLAGRTEPEREAIELRHQGFSPSEIAQRTGWNLRKVQRFFQHLRESYLPARGRPHGQEHGADLDESDEAGPSLMYRS